MNKPRCRINSGIYCQVLCALSPHNRAYPSPERPSAACLSITCPVHGFHCCTGWAESKLAPSAPPSIVPQLYNSLSWVCGLHLKPTEHSKSDGVLFHKCISHTFSKTLSNTFLAPTLLWRQDHFGGLRVLGTESSLCLIDSTGSQSNGMQGSGLCKKAVSVTWQGI